MKRAARLQDGTASQILAIKSLYSSSLAFLQEQSIQGWVKQVFGKLDSRLRLFHGGSRTRQLITSYTPGKTAVRTGNRELWTIIAISSRICSEHRGPPPAQDPDGPQAPPTGRMSPTGAVLPAAVRQALAATRCHISASAPLYVRPQRSREYRLRPKAGWSEEALNG